VTKPTKLNLEKTLQLLRQPDAKLVRMHSNNSRAGFYVWPRGAHSGRHRPSAAGAQRCPAVRARLASRSSAELATGQLAGVELVPRRARPWLLR
jgi:hypothetical protein